MYIRNTKQVGFFLLLLLDYQAEGNHKIYNRFFNSKVAAHCKINVND